MLSTFPAVWQLKTPSHMAIILKSSTSNSFPMSALWCVRDELSQQEGNFQQNLCRVKGILTGSWRLLLYTCFDYLHSKEIKRRSEQHRFSQVPELMKMPYLEHFKYQKEDGEIHISKKQPSQKEHKFWWFFFFVVWRLIFFSAVHFSCPFFHKFLFCFVSTFAWRVTFLQVQMGISDEWVAPFF